MNRLPRWLFPLSSFVVLVFAGFPSPLGADEVVLADDVHVEYDGIDETRAKAIAKMVSAARQAYIDVFKFESTVLSATCLVLAAADDKPSRVDHLQSIRTEYAKASEDFGNAIRAGTIKPNEDGEYPGWAEVIQRFAKPARALIDADPADAVALDALLFSLNELEVGDIDPGLYQVILKHHIANEKIDPLIRARSAPVDFLRGVAAQSPHARIRLWANYHLAENRYRAGKPSEAEPLLEALKSNATAQEMGGYTSGTLADTAGRLLFEMRRLSVGQEVPEVTGRDLDGAPLKLSESRGKVTLIVFWATWCGPCMAMVPHERALAERYAGKPFAIVGVNGDILRDPNFNVIGADGKAIDDTERVKAAVDKNKITWRSFRSGQHGIAADWNVRSWPTVYLVDHRGIIRGKWKGDPGAKALDTAVEKLVNIAQAVATADEPQAAAAKQPRVEGYRVELPDGATVELVGIGEHPQEPGAQWWKPDGKTLEPAVDRESFITADLRRALTMGQDSVLLREVAARVRIDPLASARLSGAADSAVQGGTRYGENGLIRGSYSFTAEKEPLKISVAYSGGKWTRRASADVGGKSDVKDVKFEPLVSENGSVNGSVTHPWLTDETRVVAFNRQGKRHVSVGNSYSQRGKLATLGYRFDDVALADIAAIHLESRPTTVVEFRGAALKPGEKADVEIRIDGRPLSESPVPEPAKEEPAQAVPIQ